VMHDVLSCLRIDLCQGANWGQRSGGWGRVQAANSSGDASSCQERRSALDKLRFWNTKLKSDPSMQGWYMTRFYLFYHIFYYYIYKIEMLVSMYEVCMSMSLFKVKVTLRPTVSRSVSPGFKPHLGLMTGH
jgi:hypothetical protein